MNITLRFWVTNSFNHNLNTSCCLPSDACLLITSPCCFFLVLSALLPLPAFSCLPPTAWFILPALRWLSLATCFLLLVWWFLLLPLHSVWSTWPPSDAYLPPPDSLLLSTCLLLFACYFLQPQQFVVSTPCCYLLPLARRSISIKFQMLPCIFKDSVFVFSSRLIERKVSKFLVSL